MRKYDQIAEWYATVRNAEVGVADLTAFARSLPPQARVLDLGCGNGVPISRPLVESGFEVVAVDSSPQMIARYRASFPGVSTRCERIEETRFPAESFAGVVAWGMLFHLPRAEQEEAIRKIAEWLSPGGRLLFTSGPVEATTQSDMNGVKFGYVSLGVAAYRSALAAAGMKLVDHYSDAWENYVCLAEKADA